MLNSDIAHFFDRRVSWELRPQKLLQRSLVMHIYLQLAYLTLAFVQARTRGNTYFPLAISTLRDLYRDGVPTVDTLGRKLSALLPMYCSRAAVPAWAALLPLVYERLSWTQGVL